jgi:hypothetical protein
MQHFNKMHEFRSLYYIPDIIYAGNNSLSYGISLAQGMICYRYVEIANLRRLDEVLTRSPKKISSHCAHILT